MPPAGHSPTHPGRIGLGDAYMPAGDARVGLGLIDPLNSTLFEFSCALRIWGLSFRVIDVRRRPFWGDWVVVMG